MSINGTELTRMCNDYDVSYDELKTAAAFQLIAGGHLTQGKGDVAGLADRIAKIMDESEMAGTIKWATWVKEARAKKQPGQNVDELIKLRKSA